jgi:hypothetical protein
LTLSTVGADEPDQRTLADPAVVHVGGFAQAIVPTSTLPSLLAA